MENIYLKSITRFVDEIEKIDNLEIVAEVEGGGCNGSDILVIENSNIAKDVEGHQTTVELPEVFAKCGDEKQAKRFADVVNCTANPIRLEGVTRIVGYYSRVNNWNKSKIGELRDRQNGQYGTGNHVKQHHEEAMATVDAM
jgi:anaerobic ribonucleoside-triphosphate reductase